MRWDDIPDDDFDGLWIDNEAQVLVAAYDDSTALARSVAAGYCRQMRRDARVDVGISEKGAFVGAGDHLDVRDGGEEWLLRRLIYPDQRGVRPCDHDDVSGAAVSLAAEEVLSDRIWLQRNVNMGDGDLPVLIRHDIAHRALSAPRVSARSPRRSDSNARTSWGAMFPSDTFGP